jgi:hypothetical protein
VITLGQRGAVYNNKQITISKQTERVIWDLSNIEKFDKINQLISYYYQSVTVISLYQSYKAASTVFV